MIQPLLLAAMMAISCACVVVSLRTNVLNAIFAALNIVFILFGLVIFYAAPAYVSSLFNTFKLELVTVYDLLTTAAIVTFGLVVTTGVTFISSRLAGAGFLPVVAPSIRRTNYPAAVLVGIALLAGLGFILNVAFMVRDVAIDTGAIPNFLILRQEAGGYYLFILAVFNLLPMATLYALLQREKAPALTWLFWLLYAISAIALLATFQKRPLIIFMALIAVATCILYWRRNHLTVSKALRPLPLARMGLILCVPVVTLFSLYFVEQRFGGGIDFPATKTEVAEPATNPGRPPVAAQKQMPPAIPSTLPPAKISLPAPTTAQRLSLAFQSTVSRTLGRMAISSVLVVSHIPENHPHYGLANVGLLARLEGRPLYDPGADAFAHFTRAQGAIEGTVATPAFIDLYGEFGWAGLFVGSAFIGLFFGALQIVLRSVRNDFHSWLFLLASGGLWIYYLTQANIFRAALGYGGGIFIISWVVFYGWSNFYRGRKSEQEAVPPSS